MNKQEFLNFLAGRLQGLPKDELRKSLDFYEESISDHMEDGMTEDEAVAAMGNIEDIVNQILSDTPLPKLVKEKIIPKRRISIGGIVLIILGAPLWLPLLLTLAALLLVFYVTLWCIILGVCAVELAIGLSALACIPGGIFLIFASHPAVGFAMVGGGLICAGIAVFGYLATYWITVGLFRLTKGMVLSIKSRILRKEVQA